jgi:hypothetical protein
MSYKEQNQQMRHRYIERSRQRFLPRSAGEAPTTTSTRARQMQIRYNDAWAWRHRRLGGALRGGLQSTDCNGFQPFQDYDPSKPCQRVVTTDQKDLAQKCANPDQPWFGKQPRAPSGRVCLGFQAPYNATCEKSPDNIKCHLERKPKDCNYLERPDWTPCVNELYITCLERGLIPTSSTNPTKAPVVWVTDPQKIVRKSPAFVTDNEACHWYQQLNQWPKAQAGAALSSNQ